MGNMAKEIPSESTSKDCKFFSVSTTGLNVKNYLSLMPNPEMHKAGNNIKFQTEINTVVTQLL